MIEQPSWATISAWALDFTRAMIERPLWAKVLFRLCLGKYAYREFIGMMDALERDGFSPYFEYCAETCRYQDDPVPALRWWKERKPIPLEYIP